MSCKYNNCKICGYKSECEIYKENADLKCECRRCVYSDTPCILSDYGKDKNGICDHFKDVFDELKKWKDEWKEKVQEATDEGYARTLQTMQLNKAKQFIRDFLSVAIDYIDPIDKNYSLIEEGQQLLSEVEK